MWFKQNINTLVRKQTSQNRDVLKGIVLDRNERVDYFDKKIFLKIQKNVSRESLNTIPDINLLYKQLAKYHKINSKNIYVTQGITECMGQIMFSLVKKNEEVIIMEPSYPMYEVLLKLNNIKTKKWRFNNNLKLEISDLKKIINSKTKILFLVNPNLPIEYEFSDRYKKEIKKLSIKHNFLVVYDEAYHYFGAKSELENATKQKNLIVLRTFSKAWGLSGIRLGYMISSKKIANYLSKCRSLVETNALSYQIGLWALKNKYILKNHIKDVKNGEKFLRKKFLSINEKYYGGKITNAILIDLKSKKMVHSLKNFLEKKKIYVRAGFSNPISNFIRVSLCSSKKLSIFFKQFKNWKNKSFH